jgi:hypothetical protein
MPSVFVPGTKLPAWAVFLTLAALCFPGCTVDQTRRTAYETLHNMSDEKNALDPRYDSSERENYDLYQQQRDEQLKEQKGEGAE